MSGSDKAGTYSRAFAALVQDSQDLTGLVAYALYKQAINEAAAEGRAVQPAGDRHPTRTEIQTYRNAADAKLSEFGTSAIEQSRAEIAETTLRADFRQAKTDLADAIRRATSWKVALAVNLVAWFVTIALTAFVVIAGVPAWLVHYAQTRP